MSSFHKLGAPLPSLRGMLIAVVVSWLVISAGIYVVFQVAKGEYLDWKAHVMQVDSVTTQGS